MCVCVRERERERERERKATKVSKSSQRELSKMKIGEMKRTKEGMNVCVKSHQSLRGGVGESVPRYLKRHRQLLFIEN